MSNYVASGWKRDLTYIIGCCWVAQVGSLDSEEWQVAIRKFLTVMRNKRAIEWMDIKELSPLRMDRAWRLLSLETGTIGPASSLPSPPRATSAQRTRGPTQWMTSPTEVDLNWDPGDWSL